jgi:aerobic carbon-monoxide dehydrogenase medium subunit
VIPFDWEEPETLAAAAGMLELDDDTVRPIAGGTALMLMMKAGVFRPSRLVSLEKIEPRYSQIRVDADGALVAGGMASLAALERAGAVAKHFPVVTRALKTLSNIRVRNVARVGGALAHGDPHMDLPPLMAGLGARVSVISPAGSREIAVEDLYAGFYETHLAKNELIAELLVPPLNGARAAYRKVTSRAADDWPALVLCVRLEMTDGVISDARLVLSAAVEKVTRLKIAEAALAGTKGEDSALMSAADAAAGEIEPLSDAHGSAPYKRELLRVTVRRTLHEAMGNRA